MSWPNQPAGALSEEEEAGAEANESLIGGRDEVEAELDATAIGDGGGWIFLSFGKSELERLDGLVGVGCRWSGEMSFTLLYDGGSSSLGTPNLSRIIQQISKTGKRSDPRGVASRSSNERCDQGCDKEGTADGAQPETK